MRVARSGSQLQPPSVVESVRPLIVVPLTTGAVVLAGGAGAITAVAAEVASVEPAPLVAVTATRIVPPASGAASVYVLAPAPAMSEHALPAESQRRHWYAKLVGEPLQVPVEAVSWLPAVVVPETAGGTVFAGGGPVTAGV